jgi:hypothetical protein
LGEIAKGHHDDGRKYLGHGGVQVELFDEKLYEDIVKSETDADEEKIAEELDAAMKGRLWKNDILVEQVAGGETDAKGHEKRQDIGRDGKEAEIDVVFVEDIVITDEVQDDIQHGIGTSAHRIAKGLDGHERLKGGIEEIDKIGNPLFDHILRWLDVRR